MSISVKNLRHASYALMLILPLLMLGSVLALVSQGFGVTNFGAFVIEHDLPGPARERALVWWLAMSLPLALWLGALWKLFYVFRSFAKAEFIEVKAVTYLRGFAFLAVLTVVASVALSGVINWATNAAFDLGSCVILTISSEQCLLLFLAVVMFIFAGVMLQADAYKKEIEEYV